MSENDNNTLSRRKILKGSAVGALVAFSSTATATNRETHLTETEREEVLRNYQSPKVVERVVHEQSDILEEMAEDGVLKKPSIADLDELTEPKEGVGEHLTVYQVGKRHTPQIKIFRRVEEGYLSLSVFPEVDTAHAILNPVKDGDPLGKDHLVKYGNMPEAQVEPQACYAPWECYGCAGCYTYCCNSGPNNTCYEYCEDCQCTCSPDYC